MFCNLFKSKRIPRVENIVRYTPKEDITTYEVSKCLEIMIGLFNYRNIMGYEIAKEFVLNYPDEVRRHFTF